MLVCVLNNNNNNNDLIRDIVGIRDAHLLERMQLDSKLIWQLQLKQHTNQKLWNNSNLHREAQFQRHPSMQYRNPKREATQNHVSTNRIEADKNCVAEKFW